MIRHFVVHGRLRNPEFPESSQKGSNASLVQHQMFKYYPPPLPNSKFRLRTRQSQHPPKKVGSCLSTPKKRLAPAAAPLKRLVPAAATPKKVSSGRSTPQKRLAPAPAPLKRLAPAPAPPKRLAPIAAPQRCFLLPFLFNLETFFMRTELALISYPGCWGFFPIHCFIRRIFFPEESLPDSGNHFPEVPRMVHIARE